MKRQITIFTKIFKSIIRKKDLIDSGNLFKHLKVYVKDNSNVFTISIESVDYLTYLWEKYNLLDEFISDSRFNEELLNILIEPYQDVEYVLDGKVKAYKVIEIRINNETIWSQRI